MDDRKEEGMSSASTSAFSRSVVAVVTPSDVVKKMAVAPLLSLFLLILQTSLVEISD